MLQEKHLSLYRQEDGRATANACCPSKETVGASSPQPFLPRRAERALALPIACHAGQVPTVSGIAQAKNCQLCQEFCFGVTTMSGIVKNVPCQPD